MEIKITYEAKSLDEVLELLQVGGPSVQVTEPIGSDDPVAEEETVHYSQEDLTELAVKANKAKKLSQVKSILDKHDIAKISQVPDELTDEVGKELNQLLEEV